MFATLDTHPQNTQIVCKKKTKCRILVTDDDDVDDIVVFYFCNI